MILEQVLAENAWQLADGLYRILLPLPWAVPFVNAYVVESRGHYLLIDCGTSWETSLRALGRALKAVGVGEQGLDAIVLTHRHPDHADGARAVQARWGGQVMLHPADMALQYPSAAAMAAWAREHGADPETVARLARDTRERPGPPPEPVVPLVPGEPLVLGDLRFEVIHMPGHAPGQVVLREPRRGWLFTADQVLNVLAPNVWAGPESSGNPLGDYLASLERLARLEAAAQATPAAGPAPGTEAAPAAGPAPGLILPGHGMPARGGLAAAARAMAEFHRAFAQRVLGCLAGGPLTAWEVTRCLQPRGVGGTRGMVSHLSEVVAALIYLAELGKVSRLPRGRWARREREEALS